jgi:hypothetical protein
MGKFEKGTPNKTTLPIAELCEFHKVNPIEVLIEYCKPIPPGLSPEQMLSRAGYRFQAARELAQYLYPKRKALEIDSTINVELAKRAEEYSKLPKDEQIMLMEQELRRLKGGA